MGAVSDTPAGEKVPQIDRCVCVCVCPTLDKGFFHHLRSTSRGVEQACRAPLNKALCSVLRISARTLADVPARSFTSCYSNLPLLIHGSSRFPPHKHSSPAAVQPVRVSAACECQHCSTIQFELTFPPCCSIAFLPNETIALTENPSSKCVLLSRPTRVLSVNPFTGALSHRASTN